MSAARTRAGAFRRPLRGARSVGRSRVVRSGAETAGSSYRIDRPQTYATSGGGATTRSADVDPATGYPVTSAEMRSSLPALRQPREPDRCRAEGGLVDLSTILSDLADENADLDQLVAELADQAWATPTPAEGWTVAHQIGHLAWTDSAAHQAVTDPTAFTEGLERPVDEILAGLEEGAAEGARTPPPDLLARWRADRAALADALAHVPEGTRVPWYGPPMSPTSMATARLMEAWAHGQDVADALGVTRIPTGRLRHIAHIAVRARGFAYLANGQELPDEQVFVSLVAPDETNWTWGDPRAEQRIEGPALDFCLAATQRRHLSDLSLRATGPDAEHWLGIVQAYAGPPGGGRRPGQFD